MALLACSGRAKVALPGGCPIGSRPVDLHLKGSVATAVIENGMAILNSMSVR